MTTFADATDETFDAQVRETRVALVDFWAPWCRPCAQLEPVLAELANELQGQVTMLRASADDCPGLVDRFGITSLPTMLILVDGEVESSLIGSRPKATIREALTRLVAA